MDIRKGNIFTLLEDDDAEEVQAPKSKQPKAQPAASTQAKSDPKPKPKTVKKQAEPEPAAPVPQAPGKEPRKGKQEEKPERDDRKSRTGRGREMKKGGGGKHNWGKPEDDVKAEPETTWEGNKEPKHPEPAVESEEPKQEEPVEKKPDFITFSDYLSPKDPAEEEKNSDDEEEQSKGKDLLNFKVSFGSRSERRGRGRGRRGGETRDTRPNKEGRNQDRNVNRDQQVPNPLDFKSFPSLA